MALLISYLLATPDVPTMVLHMRRQLFLIVALLVCLVASGELLIYLRIQYTSTYNSGGTPRRDVMDYASRNDTNPLCCWDTRYMNELSWQVDIISSGCATVFVAVALFADSLKSEHASSKYRKVIGDEVLTFIDQSQRQPAEIKHNCKILLAHPPNLKCGDCDRKNWTVVHLRRPPYDGDDARSAHSLKVFAPFLFPNAQKIVSGDTKCKHSEFFERMKAHERASTAEAFFLRHPRQKRNMSFGELHEEFNASIVRLNVKQGDKDFDDIMRTQHRYARMGLLGHDIDSPGRLPDTKCIGFNFPTRLLRFACSWNCEIIEYSMREQLSFDFARRVSNKDTTGSFEWI